MASSANPANIPSIKLNTGHAMPQLGLGTWRAPPAVMDAVVRRSIELGYRHLDCAAVYQNEAAIGRTLASLYAEKKVRRQDLFLTSKVWNTHHRAERVEQACRQTLRDLQTDYLDLYLIHFPIAFADQPVPTDNLVPTDPKTGRLQLDRVSLQDTWRAMERLVALGLVRSIGVSNYTLPTMLDILAYAKIKPAVNQIEIHPYFTRPELRRLCEEAGVIVTAYSPLGSGKHGPLQDDYIAKVAEKHGKSPAQVLIKWSLQRGMICIPKTEKVERLRENFNVFDFQLTDDELTRIDRLNRNLRTCVPAEFWAGFDFTEQ